VRHATPLFAVRILNLLKRLALVLMLDNREKVLAGQGSFARLSRLGLARCTGFGLSFEFLCETEKTKPESHVQAFNPVDHVNPV
jgi:hypothetical protein